MGTRKRSGAARFESILCAVDFSDRSSAALQLAARLARRSGARLTALYVDDPLLGAGAAATGYDTTLLRKSSLAQLERLTDRIVTPAGLGRDAWRVEIVPGNPARTIVSFAKKMPADLIVMGTNGRRGPARLVFGSVAENVLRNAPAPMLIVARNRPTRGESDPQTGPVIGALNLGPHERSDAQKMARAAAMFGGELTLVHVVARAGALAAITGTDDHHQHELAAAQKRLERVATGVGARSRVVLGHPEEEIAAAAVDAKAGLIVLALRQGSGILGSRQGTTTYRVLCTSAIPVLALPPNK